MVSPIRMLEVANHKDENFSQRKKKQKVKEISQYILAA